MIHTQEKYQNHTKKTKMVELVDKDLKTTLKNLISRLKDVKKKKKGGA